MIFCWSSARVRAFFSAASSLRFYSASCYWLRTIYLMLAAFSWSYYFYIINNSCCSRFSYFTRSASSNYFRYNYSLVKLMLSLMLFFMFWFFSKSIRSSRSFSRLRCSLRRIYSWLRCFTCIISLAFFLVSSIFFQAYNLRKLSAQIPKSKEKLPLFEKKKRATLEWDHGCKQFVSYLLFLHFQKSNAVRKKFNIIFCLFTGNSWSHKALSHRETSVSIIFIMILVLWLSIFSLFIFISFIILRLIFVMFNSTLFILMVVFSSVILAFTSTTVSYLYQNEFTLSSVYCRLFLPLNDSLYFSLHWSKCLYDPFTWHN